MDIIQVHPVLFKTGDLDKDADDNLAISHCSSVIQKDMEFDPDMVA